MFKRIICIITAALMLVSALPILAEANRTEAKDARSLVDGEYTVAHWNFETDPIEDGWTFIDSDGDGHNWEWRQSAQHANSGSGTIASYSYYDHYGVNPDNWAITPEVSIPKDYTELTFWGRNRALTGHDLFMVYAGIKPELGFLRPLGPARAFRGTTYEQIRIDVSEFAGQTVYFAIRHCNSYNEYEFFFDDVSIVSGGEPVVEPEDLILSESFESTFDLDEWTLTDADGDGKNWMHICTSDNVAYAYDGIGNMGSKSYEVTGLRPDNWLISPEIALPEEGLELTFRAAGTDNVWDAYYHEHFSVYVGRAPYPDTMDLVLSDVVTGQDYELYTVDLSDYAYETVHIAIRHHNSYNENLLRVDDFKVWGSGNYQPPEPEAPPMPDLHYGDVDLNSSVEITDGLMLMRWLVGMDELNEEQLAVAEVQGNGSVNMDDALLIMRYAIGTIPHFPIFPYSYPRF